MDAHTHTHETIKLSQLIVFYLKCKVVKYELAEVTVTRLLSEILWGEEGEKWSKRNQESLRVTFSQKLGAQIEPLLQSGSMSVDGNRSRKHQNRFMNRGNC